MGENEIQQEEGQAQTQQGSTQNLNDREQAAIQEDKNGLIERAERLASVIENAEKNLAKRMFDFEKKVAEQILSGRSTGSNFKTQTQRDTEEAQKVVKNMLG